MGFRAHENVLIVPSKLGTAFVPVSVQDDFKKALGEANLPRIRFQGLRQTAASITVGNYAPASATATDLSLEKERRLRRIT